MSTDFTRRAPLVAARALPERPLRALSIQQPWAYLIVAGYKPLENRVWKPPLPRGGEWFAVQASLKIDREAFAALEAEGVQIDDPATLHTGVVVGAMLIDGYVTESESGWFIGPVGWTIGAVMKLPDPIRCKGMLGTFRLPSDVDDLVIRQWSDAEHRRWDR